MARLGDLVVTIGAKTKSFDKALGDSMRKLKNFGRNTKQLGKNLTMGVTAPLAALGGVAVKTAASFEFSMAKVQAVSGFAVGEMERLEAQAKALGGSTSKSASEVAGLQLELAKLGKTSGEIEAMTESILSLSIAFDTDLGETSAVVGETLNQFGLSADQTARVADNMATLFGSSALDLERFGSAMSVVGPTAAAMGLSVEETGAALGVLVNAGVDASTAGTSLTKALTTLAAKGMTGEQAMSSLFNGTLSVAEGFDIFGDRAGKIIPILQKGGDSMAQLTQKQLDGAGAAAKARSVLENTAQGGFDKLRSSVEALGISFGEVLLPFVNQATDFIGDLATRFSNLSGGTKRMIGIFAGIAAVVGPLIFALASVAGAVSTIAGVLSGPVVLGIAAVAGAALLIYEYWDELVSYFTEGPGATFMQGVYDYINTYINFIISYYTFLWDSIKAIWDYIGPYVVDTLTKSFNLVQRIFAKLFNAIGTLFSSFSDLFQGNWGDFAKKISNVFIDAIQALLLGLNFGLGSMLNLVDQGMRLLGMDSGLADGFATVIDGMVEGLESLRFEFDKTKSEGRDFLKEISDFAGGLFSGGGGGPSMPTAPSNAAATAATQVDPVFAEIEDTDPEEIFADEEQYLANWVKGVNEGKEANERFNQSVQQLAGSLQGQFSNLFSGLMNGTQSFGEFMRKTLTDLLIQLASMAAAFAVISILMPGSSVAKGGLGAFLKGGFNIPTFANGGIVSGPTLGLMGEYGGAATNPEVIAPLDRLQSMMGGGQHVTVTGRISGRDILISNERAAADRSRNRGF